MWAGILAGAVFMMMEMLLVRTVNGDSPWGPSRIIAAMAMGEDVLPPPVGFAFSPVMGRSPSLLHNPVRDPAMSARR